MIVFDSWLSTSNEQPNEDYFHNIMKLQEVSQHPLRIHFSKLSKNRTWCLMSQCNKERNIPFFKSNNISPTRAKWWFGVIVVIEIVDRWHCRIFITYIRNYCSRWEDHKYQGLDWIIRTCADPGAVLVTTHSSHDLRSLVSASRLRSWIPEKYLASVHLIMWQQKQ